jgi:SAM-dependent methyltransferase
MNRTPVGASAAEGASLGDLRPGDVETRTVVPLPPAEAFDRILDELATGLERRGLRLEPGLHGRLSERAADGRIVEVGRVTAWEPGRRVRFSWRFLERDSAAAPGAAELTFWPVEGGTLVRLARRGRDDAVLGSDPTEGAAWFASAVLAPLLRASAPEALGDWVTDRRARRPFGTSAREVYREPVYHLPNFAAILTGLGLGPGDRLLEVGCGGGAFLKRALASGCRAWGLDHSQDLLRVAREQNDAAAREGRVSFAAGDAHRLPFRDGAFTVAVMTGVFQFLRGPLDALREIRRTLGPGGRAAVFLGSKALRGTPAAPEPIASRLRWYEPEEVGALARRAGFSEVRVETPDLGAYARQAGVPPEALPLFEGGKGAILLRARTD